MNWEYSPCVNLEAVTLAKKFNVSTFLMTLLLNRGFSDEESIDKFIHPKISYFRNPFDFENMEKVVSKILYMKNKKKKIFIYGDYDVDGITATVFLTKAFRNIGIDTEYYIPNRMEEEYGLDKENLKYMKSCGAELVITVDTSISSIEDIRYGRSIGIDVIITDHHKSAKEKEDDEVLYINPKLSENYKFKALAGAGVALKVAQAVYSKLGLNLDLLYNYMDIVMIGTVADVVPILDENRIIVKEGLKRLRETKIKGLTLLLRYLKFQNKSITTTDVSYFVSPLINSLGRIGVSKIGADFFIENNENKIYDIIEEMKKSNKRRRELEKFIYDEAVEIIEKDRERFANSIFLTSTTWHHGVIGIVSSRLCIKYQVPVVLISVADGYGKASSRSLSGINIFNILKDMKEHLIRFGGHDLAAGFIAKEENLDIIKNIFKTQVNLINIVKEEKKLKIDFDFPIDKIDNKILKSLELLSPYGADNPSPIFVDRNLVFENIKKFGVDNKHISGTILKNGKKYHMVGFDMGKYIDEPNYKLQKFDIAYFPERNFFKNEESIQIKLKDIQVKDEFLNIFDTTIN